MYIIKLIDARVVIESGRKIKIYQSDTTHQQKTVQNIVHLSMQQPISIAPNHSNSKLC